MIVLTDEIKKEIGQHFVFGFHGYEPSKDIATLIRDYHLGSIILFKRNIQSTPQLHGLVQKLQAVARDAGHEQPLMVGIDQENGLVSAFSSTDSTKGGTQFPGAMALGATNSLQIAEAVSNATAKEMRLVGINWAYSPVADINSDSQNPVIGVRSFGDDPLKVGQFVGAVVQGLEKAGIAASAKHFPGHGDTHVDSHLGLPKIMKTKEQLAATELVPFKKAISSGNGIATIMTGHMALPLITGDDIPSSLSKVITTDLLRMDLEYRGVIVTDCLEMEAVLATYGAEGGAVKALQAGADIVMICHTMARHVGAIEATYKAVETGILAVEDLHESTNRIRALKNRFAGAWEDVLTGRLDQDQLNLLQTENGVLSSRAYAASVAWVNNHDHSFLPLPGQDSSVVLFTPQMERINPAVDDTGVLLTPEGQIRNTAGPSYIAFRNSIVKRAPNVKHYVYAPAGVLEPQALADVTSAKAIIFATRNAHQAIWQLEFFRTVLHIAIDAGKTKVVAVSSCAPYDSPLMRDLGIPMLGTFEFTAAALETAAAVLFDGLQAFGESPVKL